MVFSLGQSVSQEGVDIVEHLDLHRVGHRGNGLGIGGTQRASESRADDVDRCHHTHHQQDQTHNGAEGLSQKFVTRLGGEVTDLTSIDKRLDSLTLEV